MEAERQADGHGAGLDGAGGWDGVGRCRRQRGREESKVIATDQLQEVWPAYQFGPRGKSRKVSSGLWWKVVTEVIELFGIFFFFYYIYSYFFFVFILFLTCSHARVI